MPTRKITSEGYFRTLLILWAAMLMSHLSISGVSIYLYFMGELPPSDPETAMPLIYALAGVGAGCLGAAVVLGNSLIVKAADKPTLKEKLSGFQTASILRFALLEAPSIMGLVGVMLTGELLFLTASAVSAMTLLAFRPSKQRAIEGLRLSGEDLRLVEDPRAVVMEVEVTSAD
ncbi:MAG: hypothetical protein U0176_09480 [Bacteroidia bacterium]